MRARQLRCGNRNVLLNTLDLQERLRDSQQSRRLAWQVLPEIRQGDFHQLGQDFDELEKIASERELPRDVLQTIHHMVRQQRALGLSETQLRERLNQLQELHILPEHRVQSDLSHG